MKEKIKIFFQILRFLPICYGVNWKNELFIKDLVRWKRINNLKCNNLIAIAKLLWEKQEFRNLFIYRHNKRILFRTWVKIIYPPLNTLYIETPMIGGGLYIQHGFSTMISAKSIGENCWINQQVTIGYTGRGCPIIGNNVMVTCGAKVLGDIIIGDNVIIGANAVVVKSVDNDLVMGGIPAKPIK